MSLINGIVIKSELNNTIDEFCGNVIKEETVKCEDIAFMYDGVKECNNVIIKDEITHIPTNSNQSNKKFSKSQDLNCKFCEKIFHERRILDNHVLKLHPNENYVITSKLHSCELCTFKTTVKKELRRHLFNLHSQVIDATSTPNILQGELDTKVKSEELEEEIKIEYVDIDCKNIKHIDDNVKQEETLTKRKKRHICAHCDYQTDFRRAIKEHMSIHDKEKAELFKCHQCTFTTYYKMGLHTHMKRHGKREKFNCTFCKKTFYGKRVLHNHLLKCHPKEEYEITSKLHTCQLCEFKTTEKKEITRHMRKHSQVIHPKHCFTLAYNCSCHKSVRKQFYKCSQCTYQSEHVSEFQKHLTTHVCTP